MHILIVGSPRSRTSYIASACANQYKIKNFHEDYDDYFSDFYERNRLLKKPIEIHDVVKKRELFLQNYTNNLFDMPGCVIKLFPRHIITLQHADKILKKIDDLKYQVIENISDILRLQDFDKIYVMHRSLVESAISFAYAKQVGYMLYIFPQKVKNKKLTIQQNVLDELNYFLLENIVLEDLQTFLNNNYNCINLDFHKAIEYVDIEFTDKGQIMYQDPKYNYKNLILNYSEVEDYIHKTFSNLQSKRIECNFR